MSIDEILKRQREYFQSGETLDVNFRISALKKLYSAIKDREDDIVNALKADLGKSEYESFMCEIGMTLSEISYMIKNVRRFSKEKTVKTPLAQFYSRSFIKPSPYGNALIMSPWNYPFLLTVDPLVNAIAAGNTALIKPSAYSPNTSELIKSLIGECFEDKFVAVVTGGRRENSELLEKKWDMIFFTGSQSVGKEVMKKAAEHLTPVVLELGGKSPCIVDKSADIKLAAKRIVFGKFLNCGQTCVAPDYILCDKAVEDELLSEIANEINIQFKDALNNENYGKIINEKHFERLLGLIDEDKIAYRGAYDREKLKIAPTVMRGVSFEDKVMQEEIFGPILPVMTYVSFEEVFELLKDKQKPLALYIFSEDKENINAVTSRLNFGGGCINDTIIHLATSEMGFGGVGESGMGSYHGESGFKAFSHCKSIVDKKTWIDLPMRYQPYKEKNLKLIKKLMK